MDERVLRLVLSQPIPMRLSEALERAPDLSRFRTPERVLKARGYGVPSLDPEDLTPILRRSLILVCHGYSDAEIGNRTHYALSTVKSRIKALLAIFNARTRAHLAALAVAQGYVDMTLAVE